MTPGEVRLGQRLTVVPAGRRSCTVTAVRRTLWRKRLTRFWVRWDGTDADAEHLPQDAYYLSPVGTVTEES